MGAERDPGAREDRRRMYLLRHAEVSYFPDQSRPVRAQDVVLTEAGIEQARAAGRALAGARIDRVLTSGLPRTIDTARLVVEQLNEPPAQAEFESWPEFEEFRPGRLREIADEDLENAFLELFRGKPRPEASYLRGEPLSSVVARVDSALTRIYADPGWHTILLVAHGGVNRAVLSWALAGPGAFFSHFEQLPGAINIIDGEPERFILRTTNLTPYDAVQLSTRKTTIELLVDEARAYREAKTLRKGR